MNALSSGCTNLTCLAMSAQQFRNHQDLETILLLTSTGFRYHYTKFRITSQNITKLWKIRTFITPYFRNAYAV